MTSQQNIARSATVTFDTNRLFTFAAAYGLSVEEVVRWNLDYFGVHNTFWLPVGRDFNIVPPAVATGLRLIVNNDYLLIDGDYLVV